MGFPPVTAAPTDILVHAPDSSDGEPARDDTSQSISAKESEQNHFMNQPVTPRWHRAWQQYGAYGVETSVNQQRRYADISKRD